MYPSRKFGSDGKYVADSLPLALDAIVKREVYVRNVVSLTVAAVPYGAPTQ